MSLQSTHEGFVKRTDGTPSVKRYGLYSSTTVRKFGTG